MVKSRSLLPLLFVLAFMAFAGSASAATYTNITPITIPDSGAASVYPSTINVTGQTGPIKDVSVALFNVGHTNPADLDILVVSPSGKAAMVMSDSCGSGNVEDQIWALHPTVKRNMTVMGNSCPDINYHATDKGFGGPDSWPGAPAPPYTTRFESLFGEDPNGEWKLYVIDDTPGNSGDIETGWGLIFETQKSEVVIPSIGPADPYPAKQTVTGQEGVVSDLNVVISGLHHTRPDDLDALLVGPGGQKVMLMSDACGDANIPSAGWIIDDDMGATGLPDATACSFSPRHTPTDHEPGENLSAPAPPGPYATKMSAFEGTDPNGEWKLYIEDDTAGGSGWISYGSPTGMPFYVGVTTRPKAAVELTPAKFALNEGETRSVTVRRRASSEVAAGSVRVTTRPGSASAGSDFTPISRTINFAPGETEKAVPVRALIDRVVEPAETFSVTVDSPTGDAAVGTPASRVDVTIAGAPRRPAGPGGDAGDRTPPVIRAITLRTFRRGTKIRYRLSERARVTMRVQRRAGRRWKRAARLTQAGRAGVNRKIFSGRAGRKVLRRGRYRLVITAVDAAGNRAKAKPRRFRIAKRR
jgi:subtilisin-like proprotein convertase family protein